MRSVLFCPASNTRALAKVATTACDAVIVDLEDAVGAANKVNARATAERAFQDGFGAKVTALRTNVPESEYFAEDVALARRIGPDAVVIPKAESIEDVQAAALAVDGPLWLMIETAKGVINAAGMAGLPSVAALILGPNDLRVDLGAGDSTDRSNLHYAMSAIVTAARAAGIYAFDGVYNNFRDEEGLSAEAVQGKLFGFHGKTLIHPAQVDPVNAVFAPSAAEISRAKAIIAAFETGSGNAVQLDGELIEELHVHAAKAMLRLTGER